MFLIAWFNLACIGTFHSVPCFVCVFEVTASAMEATGCNVLSQAARATKSLDAIKRTITIYHHLLIILTFNVVSLLLLSFNNVDKRPFAPPAPCKVRLETTNPQIVSVSV